LQSPKNEIRLLKIARHEPWGKNRTSDSKALISTSPSAEMTFPAD
jgi:hypothetical protein